jgi:hypothetical protein
MGWLREACSDSDSQVDMAYIVIGALAVTAIFALAFIFAMSAVDYIHCQPTISLSNTPDDQTRHIVPCRFDPLPVGQASGLIFGAFSALIGALAGYMAATRRSPRTTETTVTASSQQATVTTTTPKRK